MKWDCLGLWKIVCVLNYPQKRGINNSEDIAYAMPFFYA